MIDTQDSILPPYYIIIIIREEFSYSIMIGTVISIYVGLWGTAGLPGIGGAGLLPSPGLLENQGKTYK